MKRVCTVSGETFEVTAEDLEFYQRMSPVFAGKRYDLPPPTLSPIERQRRRLSFRGIRTLHRRKCDLSGRSLISWLPPESPHKVYHSDEWWSDRWDALEYGRDFDFNRPFFDQFHELYLDVPLIHLFQTPNENCEYINGASNCRNCYLSFLMDHSEDCYYMTVANGVRSSLDSFGLTNCELCYECVDCLGCYSLRYSNRCSGCSDSAFLLNCRECRSCIGCCNLAGKEFYVFNEKVSKVEFERVAAKLSSASGVRELSAEFEQFSLKFPRRHFFGQSNESFSGDNISHSRNSYWCFDGKELENCRYCNFYFGSHNSMDVNYFGDGSSWIYECIATGLNCTNNMFCKVCWSGSSNNLYCHLVSGSSNCFGCSGLKRKQYCIFNKQYTQDEYERLAGRIAEHMQRTGEWGEFFPMKNAPVPVNYSQAQDYFPMTEEEAKTRGLRWGAPKASLGNGAPHITADTIERLPIEHRNTPVSCGECGAEFKIIEPELRFYQTNRIPPPRRCPECRHQARAKLRNPAQLWERNCGKCNSVISTAYSADKPFDVYCAECFVKEMY